MRISLKENKIEKALKKRNEMLENFLKKISNNDDEVDRRERKIMHNTIQKMENNFAMQKQIAAKK